MVLTASALARHTVGHVLDIDPVSKGNADVRAAIEPAGCQLVYLPASSPDFNPIELVFAKLKTYLRGVAARAFDP